MSTASEPRPGPTSTSCSGIGEPIFCHSLKHHIATIWNKKHNLALITVNFNQEIKLNKVFMTSFKECGFRPGDSGLQC